MSTLTIPKKAYQCLHCTKMYRRKRELELHQGVCELFAMSRTDREISEETTQDNMNIKEMSSIIKVLVREQNKLRKQVDILQKSLLTMKKKVNVEEYLQKHLRPNHDLISWCSTNLLLTSDDFDDLYDKKLDDVLETMILRQTACLDQVPARAFANNGASTYGYIDSTWRKLNEDDWNKMTGIIKSSMLDHLHRLTEESEAIATDDQFSIKYNSYVQKIMNYIPRVQPKLVLILNQRVKMSLSNVTKFEYSFD